MVFFEFGLWGEPMPVCKRGRESLSPFDRVKE